MPEMPAVEGQPGDTAVKPDRPTEEFFILVCVDRSGVRNLRPLGPDARVDEVPGAGDGRRKGPVHILPAVMFGPIWLPAKNGLVGGLLETQEYRLVDQPVQAYILGNSLTQRVAVEKYMPDQTHSFRVHDLSGMQSDSRIACDQLGVLPEPVVGISGYATVRVGEFPHCQPCQLFNAQCIEHSLALKVMNQCQRAGGSNQRSAGGIWLGRCHVIRPDS